MGWTTVYVHGKTAFFDEVVKNLEQADYPFMPGSREAKHLYLFWIEDGADLKTFKKAIGSKTVFKYRLRFYSNRQEYLESKKRRIVTSFTPQEEALINQMKLIEQDRAVA